MTDTGREARSARTQHDAVLEGYRDWLNDVLFQAELGDGEYLGWLGNGRWMLFSAEGPEVFVVSLERGEIVPSAPGTGANQDSPGSGGAG